MERQRRSLTVLVIALATVLMTAGAVAVDRLRPPAGGAMAVQQIRPTYTFTSVVGGSAPQRAVAAKAKKKAKPKPVRKATAARTVCPGLPAVSAKPSIAARAVVPRVTVYDRPGGKAVRTLTNPTDEGQPLHALVRGRSGIFLRIQLVARPNGATGWVHITDFSQYETPYRIVVQRCSRTLTVVKAGRPVWSRSVAVGKPRTPTPTGEFFVDFITPMRCCAYGPVMLSVAGFSNVLFQFGKGGTGQIAIHGTNADWSVGKAASNGCVRMHNNDVVALSKMVPAGTPVLIVD